MKDTDKDASEAVIEGKATVRSGRKKMSDKNSARKKTTAGNKQSGSDAQSNFDTDTTADYKTEKIEHRFSQIRILFSPRNLRWLLVFALVFFAIWVWISGKNTFFSTKDSQQLALTLEEVKHRSEEFERVLAQLQKQIGILETEIVMFKEQEARPIEDERLGVISSELRDLEAMFEKLNQKMASTRSVNVKTTKTDWLEIEKINYFIDILWIDSQTGRDLTRYPQLIQSFKTIYVNNNTLKGYFNSVDIALSGNLSSHNSLLVELNDFLMEGLVQSNMSKNLLFSKQGKEEKNGDITVVDTSNNLSWKKYFSGLVKLRKIPEENSPPEMSLPQNGNLRQKYEENLTKQLISQESYFMETVSQAISELTKLLDKGETALSSEQAKVLNLHLTQLKSRQSVDQMINDIFKNQEIKSAREDK